MFTGSDPYEVLCVVVARLTSRLLNNYKRIFGLSAMESYSRTWYKDTYREEIAMYVVILTVRVPT